MHTASDTCVVMTVHADGLLWGTFRRYLKGGHRDSLRPRLDVGIPVLKGGHRDSLRPRLDAGIPVLKGGHRDSLRPRLDVGIPVLILRRLAVLMGNSLCANQDTLIYFLVL